MGGEDNEVIANTLLNATKTAKNPYDRRNYKKSVWKHEQWNMYRLHKKKKLRGGELKGLLRYYDVINNNSSYVNIDDSKFGSFRIHDETTKYFTSLNDFVDYLDKHPCSVYNVYLDGFRYCTPETLPEHRYRSSWELENTQEELNIKAMSIVSKFFEMYPQGRIKMK